jgi:hypothetical protein
MRVKEPLPARPFTLRHKLTVDHARARGGERKERGGREERERWKKFKRECLLECVCFESTVEQKQTK